MTVTIQPTNDDAELLMRAVLREGAPIAGEYPLVFDASFDGRIVTADEDGAVRSTCAFLERELVLRSLRFKVGFVGSVATAPEYRRKGLATNVLRSAEKELTAAGCVFSLLWADEPEYYASRGYVPIGTEFNYYITPEMASKLPEASGVREARPADAGRIHELYESHLSRVVRTPDETRALLAGPGIETLVLESDGAVVAFSCMGRGADMQSVVHEWGGDAERVLALLHAHILRKSDRQPVFLLASPDDRAIVEYFEISGIPGACGVLGMAKMLDAEAACAVFARALGAGEVVVAEASEPTLIVRGPGGEIALTGPNALMTLFAPKRTRDLISVVEKETGLSLADLPLTPFAWGLDSI